MNESKNSISYSNYILLYLPSILAEFASPEDVGFDECDDKSKTFSRIVLFMV